MAISYPLSLPTVTGFASIQMRAIRASVISMSPFSFKQQTLNYSGGRWEADITLPPMDKDRARQWLGFLVALDGVKGTFLMGDPDGELPLGHAGGTPLVKGADQTGSTLQIDGATANKSQWLRAGDYIQLGSGSTSTLHMVQQDAASDASGNVTLEIFPGVRTAPADDAAVTVQGCKGLFRLADPNTTFSIQSAAIYGINFSVMEAI